MTLRLTETIKLTWMMTMTIKKSYVLIACFLLTQVTFSQKDDFGIWYGISAEHKLTKKLEIDFSANLRTFSNAGKIEESFIEGGISYNLNKIITLSGAYRLTDKIEKNNSYYFRHKVLVDIKGNLPAGNFSFSCRMRFQTGLKMYIEDKSDEYPYYTGRIKIKATYKTPTFPLDPYIYAESFFPMFSDESGNLGKSRYSTGVELSISKKHSVEAEYIFQRDYLPQISDINIISINYNIKF
jgi:hypothetical protein